MRTTGNPSVDAALQTLLASRQFYFADLYTFTLSNGSVQYVTSIDVPLTWDVVNQTATGAGAKIFTSTGLLLTRNKLTWERGISVDELDITVACRTATIGSLSWIAAAVNGGLDGAWCELDRLFLNPSIAGAGSLCLFYGPVTDVDPVSRTSMVIKVRDILDLLSQQWPINLVLPNCCWQLYGAGCTLAKASYGTWGTVASGSALTMCQTNLTQPDQYFNNGVITFTSGPLSGLFRTIQWYDNANGQVYPAVPFPSVPAAGVTFNIWPGCDHTLGAYGCGKFGNQANWRGFPYVPVPETSV